MDWKRLLGTKELLRLLRNMTTQERINVKREVDVLFRRSELRSVDHNALTDKKED